MKRIATVAAAAALLTLTACDRLGLGGGSASTNSSSNAATSSTNGSAGNASASADGPKPADGTGVQTPTGATPAGSGTITLDRAFMMGRWTDDGDCSNSVNFASDGSFTAANGTGGLWRLAGDQLTMTGSSTLTLQIEPVDQNTMTVINPDGSLGRSTRC